MISFEMPERIKNELQMAEMVARHVMRPNSRKYDVHEHERPVEYINVMWQVLREQNRRRFEKLMQQNGNGDRPQREGPNWSIVRLIAMVEMLSWGDAGMYLCTPDPLLGGAAIEAVATPEQKVRFLKKFGEGEPKWGAMAITEPGAGSDNSAMRTTAVLDEETNEWVINGEKIFITNGKLALEESDGVCVVWATVDPQAGRGWHQELRRRARHAGREHRQAGAQARHPRQRYGESRL